VNNNKKCGHKWRKAGIWDGKTPDGNRTGGIMYKCDVCGEEITDQRIGEKGGSIIQGTNAFGVPTKQ